MNSISPFNILLNNLSNELDQRNLRSLVHICRERIPGGQREGIATGLDVFSILRQHNAIGEEPKQMKFLLRIITELRPTRGDLVSMVQTHIEHNYDQPDTIEILDDVGYSSDTCSYPISRRPSQTSQLSVENDCCALRCGCFNCNCVPCCDGCCCCVIAAIFFSFLAVVAAVFWYSRSFPRVYDYLHSKDDLKDAGPVIIGVLVFIAVCCVSCGIYIFVKKRRSNLMPQSFNDQLNDVRSKQAAHGSLYAASDSTGASGSVYARKIDRPRRREHSCSSDAIYTASSSVTDGCSQQDVCQEIKAEQEDKDDNVLVEV